jgi:hypothetical protein
LVISGMGNPDPVQQGALYSVALETLTDALGEANSKDLKPVEKQVFKRLKADIEAVLPKYQEEVSAVGIEILQKKIETLNSPTNQDKLVKTFALFGIELSDSDIKAIKERNAYLHGRSPLSRELDFELTQISLRLHTLIVALLLKSVGYSGPIVNLDNNAYLIDEDKTKEIAAEDAQFYEKLVAQLTAAERDQSKLDQAREAFEAFRKESKLINQVRNV